MSDVKLSGIEVKIEFDSNRSKSLFWGTFLDQLDHSDIPSYYVTDSYGKEIRLLFEISDVTTSIATAKDLKQKFYEWENTYDEYSGTQT